jgi:hypothetical protein
MIDAPRPASTHFLPQMFDGNAMPGASAPPRLAVDAKAAAAIFTRFPSLNASMRKYYCPSELSQYT